MVHFGMYIECCIVCGWCKYIVANVVDSAKNVACAYPAGHLMIYTLAGAGFSSANKQILNGLG